MNDRMNIGELANMMNVTVRTLQYYDKLGLFSPSAMSDGGRRLYSAKDVFRLHQILSFKYLGFSLQEIRDQILPLDTPKEIAEALYQQKRAVCEQISQLQQAVKAIDALYEEVLAMEEVDFKKYAVIIELLRLEKKEYWIWKLMDSKLTDHIQRRFMDHPEAGDNILQTYHSLVDQAYKMMQEKVAPNSEEALQLSQNWWNMVNDFTGGDNSLIANLEQFHQQQDSWDKTMAKKQKAIDSYLQEIFMAYAKHMESLDEKEPEAFPWKQFK